MQSPNIWDDPKVAEALGREKSNLEKVVGVIERLSIELEETRELLELVSTEDDDEVVALIKSELASNEELISQLEFRRMFSGETDQCHGFLDIQAGSGGTEAQDWAEMLLRMYLKWGESHSFKCELIELSAGPRRIGRGRDGITVGRALAVGVADACRRHGRTGCGALAFGLGLTTVATRR